MTDDATPLLSTRGLTVTLSSKVIGPIDLDVSRGEILVLRGPNGSGKTTTIRASLGLVRASAGTSTVRGLRVDPLHPPRGVGYLPDHVEFWEWLTGAQNVLPFARDDAEVRKALTEVGLADVDDLDVRRYSRGMRQRLGIARALVGAAELVVMDEPTIALDEDALDVLERLLKESAADGRAVLVASHDAPFVERIATNVVEIRDGVAAP
jgi:ABC-type multidrug transport system ATPase subunit